MIAAARGGEAEATLVSRWPPLPTASGKRAAAKVTSKARREASQGNRLHAGATTCPTEIPSNEAPSSSAASLLVQEVSSLDDSPAESPSVPSLILYPGSLIRCGR